MGSALVATVLFAGFGDLGSAAGCLLRDAGLRVIAVKRTQTQELPGIDYHYADLRTPLILPPSLCTQVDAVVIALSPTRHDPADYAATYIAAVEHLLRAVQVAGAKPRRVLFVSSTSVWAARGDLWITEDVPAQPDSWNGEILLRAEAVLFASAWPATTLRLGGIYGPGRHRLVRQAEAIIAGREPMPPPAWTNRIHRDDAARLIAFLVNQALAGIAIDHIYIGVDNEPALNTDVLAFISASLRGVAGEVDFAAPVPPRNAGVGGKRLGNARVRALGFQFAWPDFRAGYAAVLAGRG